MNVQINFSKTRNATVEGPPNHVLVGLGMILAAALLLAYMAVTGAQRGADAFTTPSPAPAVQGN